MTIMAFGALKAKWMYFPNKLSLKQSFFLFLKLQIAQFVTFTVQVTCLSLKTLPNNVPQQRHVPAPAGVRGHQL